MQNSSYSGIAHLDVMKVAHKYNAFIEAKILAAISEHASTVDFGAGSGLFAERIRAAGKTVHTIEPDDSLREVLRTKGFDPALSILEFEPNSVESIYTVNVLEHIKDDISTLYQMFHSLRPGGTLHVYVPASPILYSSMDKAVGHYRRYRMPSLTSMLRLIGFEIQESRHVDSLGFFASLIYKFFGSKSGDLDPGAVLMYDKYLFPISLALDKLFLNSFGKNLSIVAKKP